MLRHQGVSPSQVACAVPGLDGVDPNILIRVAIDGKYHPKAIPNKYHNRCLGRYDFHLRRQEADLRIFMEDEDLTLDPSIDYQSVEGLSSEVKERLAKVRPISIVSTTYNCPLHLSNLHAGCCEADGRCDSDVNRFIAPFRETDG